MAKRNPYKGADIFTKKAHAQGFPARSVFKLEEIDRRTRLLRQGMRVLDLGACPGSWTLYAAKKVGSSGRVLAVDLDPLRTAIPDNTEFIQADAFDLDQATLERFAPYDVVLSDMAPATTGNRFTDQARSLELVLRALEVAVHLGTPGSTFVAKLFMGPDFEEARAAFRQHYADVRLIRPESTRSISKEIFMVGIGLKDPS